jgi:hypothetical protein
MVNRSRSVAVSCVSNANPTEEAVVSTTATDLLPGRTIRLPQLHQPRWWHRAIRTVLLLFAVLLVVPGIERPEAALLLLLPAVLWAVKAVGHRPIRLDATTGRLTFPHRWAGRRHLPLTRR